MAATGVTFFKVKEFGDRGAWGTYHYAFITNIELNAAHARGAGADDHNHHWVTFNQIDNAGVDIAQNLETEFGGEVGFREEVEDMEYEVGLGPSVNNLSPDTVANLLRSARGNDQCGIGAGDAAAVAGGGYRKKRKLRKSTKRKSTKRKSTKRKSTKKRRKKTRRRRRR